MTWLLFASLALAQDATIFVPAPVAGHAVFDLRVGVDQIVTPDGGPDHPFLCGEVYPLAWLSVEGCGTGSGFLHQGDETEMAHFRGRARVGSVGEGRLQGDLLVGAGFAEVQTAIDRPGFRFGPAREPDPVEAAGPEASVSAKARYWVDPGGHTYLTADLNAGAAVIPAAPELVGTRPVLPFAALTVGVGF